MRFAVIALAMLMAVVARADEVTPQELWQAANDGDAAAQYRLARHYDTPGTVDYDPSIALYWYQRAAETGSPDAAADLGIRLLALPGAVEDVPKALEWLGIAADAGIARAQYRLGTVFANGLGIADPDLARARTLFSLAAAQGHADAMATLGVFVFQGIATERSPERAEELFRKAADAGSALGLYHLGVLHFTDHYGPPDAAEGRRLIEAAAAEDLPQALLALGQMDMRDARGDDDRRAALEMVARAAGMGLADARFQYGVWRGAGIGGEPDEAEAVQWYLLAAAQGHADAQFLLGNHLATGRGVEQDVEAGIRWLEAAARGGHPAAAERIEAFRALLPETGDTAPAPSETEKVE